MIDRANEFWTPEPLFAGRTAFLLGGGPSLKGFDFARLERLAVIAINAAGYEAPFAPILFFHDNSFFERNRALVDEWSGRVITLSRHSKVAAPDRVLRLQTKPDRRFVKGEPIPSGRSSGHTALWLAAALGARRIVLLGYDCRTIEGATHYHTHYAEPEPGIYGGDFLVQWQGFGDLAREAGLEVINATPGSALTEFPSGHIDVLIREAETCAPS